MKGLRQAALAGALVLTAGFAPASTAHGQTREPLIRAFEVGRGMRLGISVHDADDADAKDAKSSRSGVVVESVDPGGPADKAGVKVGDAITEFDGERVRSVRQFSRLVQETPPGRAVTVALSRSGQRSTVTVTPEARSIDDDFSMRLLDMARMPAPPAPAQPPAAPRAPRAPSAVPVPPAVPLERYFLTTGRRLGITIETLDEQLAQYFGVKDGVLVKSVTQDSAAQKAGLKAGDVITAINGRQVYETSDVNRALDRMDNSDEFTIEVMRDRKAQTIKGKLEARSRTSMF